MTAHPQKMPIKIAIVEDHSGIRESLAILINEAGNSQSPVHSHTAAVSKLSEAKRGNGILDSSAVGRFLRLLFALRLVLSHSRRSLVRRLNISSACIGLGGLLGLAPATGLAETTPESS